MAKLQIYGVPASRAIRVIWMAKELGLDYDNIPIGFTDGSNRTPQYLAVNPNGKVPAIKDGDVVMSESLAINCYLAGRYGAAIGLAGATPQEQGAILQWTLFAAIELEQKIIDWARHSFVNPSEQRDPAIAAAARQGLAAPLGVLDGVLSARDWLVRGRFTAADLNVAATTFRLVQTETSGFPHLIAWLRRCLARPAAVAAFKLRQ